jgi:hypothetical protein
MKRTLSFLIFLVLLGGCATSVSRLDKISMGMTRDEVLQTMGKPTSISTAENVEFLNYVLFNGFREQPYYVRLRQGKVDAFGKVGDFASSKDPTSNIHLKPRED